MKLKSLAMLRTWLPSATWNNREWLAVLCVLGLLLQQPGKAAAQDGLSTSIVATVKSSLALIIVHDGKSLASGTAFCIGSHDGSAYLLTNKHVVGSDSRPRVILLSDPDSELYGRIDRVSTLDAAIIAVDGAKCNPLSLSIDSPSVGESIAIAGFPAFQLSMADDASSAEPSFHAGSVSALPASAGLIEYDAQTDHGNSGSPLFDTKTGAVLGLVTLVNTGTTGALQNNISISIKALVSFISNSHANVTFTGVSPAQPAAQPSLPASGTTVADAIDARCGAGQSKGMFNLISRASVELNANDYSSTIADSRSVIEGSGQCAIHFICPSSSCDDTKYVLLMGAQLLAQQDLRIATARTNGDSVNAIRNELFTTTTLCALPTIMNDGQPYTAVRETMKVSLKLSRIIRATGPYHGIVDTENVRDCATKLGV